MTNTSIKLKMDKSAVNNYFVLNFQGIIKVLPEEGGAPIFGAPVILFQARPHPERGGARNTPSLIKPFKLDFL